MIYRVDYLLAVIFAGMIAGALVGRWTSHIRPTRLARWYFIVIAVLVAMRIVAFVCGTVLGLGPAWSTISSVIGDAGNFLLGALFGLGLLRTEGREFLCDPAVYSALCLTSGLGFVMAGYAKALHMEGMIQFFTQSGYSTPFLKFIVAAEVFGGIGLLIPWTVLPAVAGLSIDMFGAVYTHIHNGDSIHDSTGAISALIRLGVIAVLWALRPRPGAPSASTRRRLAAVAIGAVICAGVAVAGSAMVRHLSPPSPGAVQSATSNR